jgi:hypothetical protein
MYISIHNNKLFQLLGIAIPTLMRLESPTIDARKRNTKIRVGSE